MYRTIWLLASVSAIPGWLRARREYARRGERFSLSLVEFHQLDRARKRLEMAIDGGFDSEASAELDRLTLALEGVK